MNTFTVGLWNFQPYCDMTTQTSTPNYSHWFDCWLFRIQNNQIQMKYFHLDSEAFNKKGFGNFPNLPTPQSLEFVSSIPKHILQMCCTVGSVQYCLSVRMQTPPNSIKSINQPYHHRHHHLQHLHQPCHHLCHHHHHHHHFYHHPNKHPSIFTKHSQLLSFSACFSLHFWMN